MIKYINKKILIFYNKRINFYLIVNKNKRNSFAIRL